MIPACEQNYTHKSIAQTFVDRNGQIKGLVQRPASESSSRVRELRDLSKTSIKGRQM